MNGFIEVPANAESFWRRRPLYGVGINDASYMVCLTKNNKIIDECPFYRTWVCMLARCYSDKYQARYPAYFGCTVCEDWLLFTSFRSWMKSKNWQGKELDKDLRIPGNKKYKPNSCAFVPGKLNRLLLDNRKSRGKWPVGVSFHKLANKFSARCGHNGGQKHLGYFDTPHEAYSAYALFKINIIESYKSEYPELKKGLETAIESLRERMISNED